MKLVTAAAALVLAFTLALDCSAQCRSGGGSGGGSCSGGGGTLLTSPGSWGYQVKMAQAYQQRLAQQQYAYAMAKEAQRQQKLEVRRTRAEAQREQLAQRREQIRQEELARRSRSSYSNGAYVSLRN